MFSIHISYGLLNIYNFEQTFTKAQLCIHKFFDFVSKFCFNITLVNLKDILIYILNFKIVIDFKGKFSNVISNQL